MGARSKTHLAGVDPQYVLAKKGTGANGKALVMLTDQVNHPGHPSETTMLARARAWNDSSGPRHYLRRHPALKKEWAPRRLDVSTPAANLALTVAPRPRVRIPGRQVATRRQVNRDTVSRKAVSVTK